MNSKLIAIIAVVAMCGAALVGVGYAYNATYTTGDDSITVNAEYVTIGTNGTASTDWVITDTLKYTSTNTNGTIVYKPAGSASISKTYTVVVDFKKYTKPSDVTTLDLIIAPAITNDNANITFSSPVVTYEITGAEGDPAPAADNKISITPSSGSVSYDVTITYEVTDITESYQYASMITNVSATCKVTFSMMDLA